MKHDFLWNKPRADWVCEACGAIYGFWARESTDECPGPAPAKPAKTCAFCERELCEVLDAYYGRDEYAAQYCSRCR